MSTANQKALTLDSINPNYAKIEYAVRGPIVQRALEIEKELSKGEKTSFNEVIKCNIGDCHATGQTPLTFGRQLMSLLVNVSLLDDDRFPTDVKARVKRILLGCAGKSVGSYSHSLGIPVLRQDVATYIENRDGIPANSDNIFLSSGASEAIKFLLTLVSTGLPGDSRTGIMIPIPQYPLYSATNTELNHYQIDYYLDEADNWALSADELERAIAEAKGKCQPRMIVVINPGNPTGQVLSKSCMESIIQFAVKHKLVLLADEVYHHNIYDPENHPWFSFKSVLHGMGPQYRDTLELASVMSCSKGYIGECGFRGGYCELVNFDPSVQAMLYKALSVRLCPPVLGQAMSQTFTNPPQKDEPSFAKFESERNSVLTDLKLKAELVSQTLNGLPGVSCNAVQGAMYAFPRIDLPKKAIEAAQAKNQEPDFFFCMKFLEEKGVCVVPGSGFGQKPGSYHFRITILPTVLKMEYVMRQLKDFHSSFMKEFSDN